MNAVVQASPAPTIGGDRSVIIRTRGHAHGPVTSMVRPSGIGQIIKPFIFLDFIETQEAFGQQGVGWIAVMDGSLNTPEQVREDELVVFDRSDSAIQFEATAEARFVLGTAIPHPHDLHLAYYSVHTSRAALTEGEREIARIGRKLHAKSVLH